MTCPTPHDELKRRDDLWTLLPLIGVQHTPADASGPAEDLEMRNCLCGSTLCRVVQPQSR